MVTEKQIKALVRQAQQGDTEVFSEIYDLYAPKLYNFLYARLRHKETAEDLLSTVFMKAWDNLGSYQPRASAKFSTWLFQIANFTLIDHWRTKKDVIDMSKVENLSIFAQEAKLYENYEFLFSELIKLPSEYQTVLELRFRQDLSVSETAEIMNKSEVGIRVLQHRALKLLKKNLALRGITEL